MMSETNAKEQNKGKVGGRLSVTTDGLYRFHVFRQFELPNINTIQVQRHYFFLKKKKTKAQKEVLFKIYIVITRFFIRLKAQ